jgi:hypothetical protein
MREKIFKIFSTSPPNPSPESSGEGKTSCFYRLEVRGKGTARKMVIIK